MKKLWMQRLAAAIFFTMIGGIGEAAAQDGDVNSFANGTAPIVRTEEDLVQGQQNVQRVAMELQELLHRPSSTLEMRSAMKDDAPQFVEIPDADGKATLIYYCRNTTASKLAQTLDAVCSKNGYVEYNSEQNKILICDEAARMEVFKKAITAMDQRSPQVLIEAKVVEVLVNDSMQRNLSVAVNQRDKSFNAAGEDSEVVSTGGSVLKAIGTNSSDTGAMFNWFPYAGDDTNVNVMFQWLMGAQDAKILSSPNIVISRGDTGVINTGQDIPIQEQSQNGSSISFSTKYRNIGVTMRVTPKIINSNSVLLNVNPEVSNILQYEKIQASGVTYQVPIISIRSIDTNLTMHDGQVIIMGGLFNTREVLNQERTPFLSDMPWIGELFTAKSTTKEIVQLVFILRVSVLTVAEQESGVVYNPAQQAMDSKDLGNIIRNSPAFPETPTTLETVNEELENAPGMREFKQELPQNGVEN